jgi:amino acid adenylation domain-containing protein
MVNYKYAPVSKIQEHYWTLNQLRKQDTAYNIPSVFRIVGEIDIVALKKALQTIVQNHEVLRANFQYHNKTLVQRINEEETVDFSLVKLENLSQEHNALSEVLSEIHKTFSLESDRLLRVKLFEIKKNEYFLTIVFHHIVVDLHSKDIFSKELSHLYNLFHEGKEVKSDKEEYNYLHFANFEKSWLLTEESSKQLSGWKEELKGKELILDLPNEFVGNSKGELLKGERKHFFFESNVHGDLKKIANEHAINTFNILLTTYFIVLHRISNQSEISVGIPFPNRRRDEYKDTFGCFVNILPIIVNFSDNPSFLDVSQRVRRAMLKAHRRQESPFLLINSLIEKGQSLFNTGFTFEHPMRLSLDGLSIQNQIVERQGTQLDLFFVLWEEEDQIHCLVEYALDLYSSEYATQLFNIYSTTLDSIIENPQVKVSDIKITPDVDLKKIYQLNETEVGYEDNLCIHEKLEVQAAKNPSSTALLYHSQRLTYEELNKHSNSLANYLISKNVKVEDVVSICSFRSLEMIIGIYGILKAGATYLPINPNDPTERINSIIGDAKPKFILTSKAAAKNLTSQDKLIYLDDIINEPLSSNYSNPSIGVHSHNLAYIIYTSGSTGIPKGVMIEHHSVLNRILWMQKKYPLSPKDVIMQKTPVTFDVSVWELFWWSFTGSKLSILKPDGEKDPVSILNTIAEHSVSVMHFVPSMFKIFQESLNNVNISKLESLKQIFLSGEALSPKLVNNFYGFTKPFGEIKLVNLYGPTEATVDVSYYDCPFEENRTIYIGKPIDNTKLFIINSENQIQPIGIPGELIITGVNLARGYLNRPELNELKFISLRLPNNTVVRGYKTGDLARLCPSGQIEYIGRIDNQVKIRGFRIEVGEIESKIIESPFADNCVVIADGNDESKHLVAYICKKQEGGEEVDKIKEYLKAKLPEYMIPMYFVFLDQMPLTSSGKINRKALPKPNKEIFRNSFVKADSHIEKSILAIWKKILEVDEISITDNFFDIGGNSLLAVKLSMEINSELNTNITPLHIFQNSTIKDLAFSLIKRANFEEETKDEIDERALKRKQMLRKNFKRANN